jgi:hypothetical protein
LTLAKSLSARQEENHRSQLNDFEVEPAVKLRVLTQYDNTPGRAVKDILGPRRSQHYAGGRPPRRQPAHFSVGDAVYDLPAPYLLD